MQTWRCGTYVNFNRSGTTATTCQALDGNNIVTFDGSCAAIRRIRDFIQLLQCLCKWCVVSVKMI
ncbi:MAG: hypothetical protein R2847_10895 [Bacteroidia bacterium]